MSNEATIQDLREQVAALTREKDALREALGGFEVWIRFALESDIHSQAGVIPPTFTDGYSYVKVPEWKMRQKLDDAAAALATPATTEDK